MRRYLMTLALTGLFSVLFCANDASACCFKKRCAPAPCAAPAPAPCPPRQGCCLKFKLFGCHAKRCCAPTVCAAPVMAPAPCVTCPSPQVVVSGQGS